MGSYVPTTSRRVLGILFFFAGGGKPLPRSCREFFFSKIFICFNLFDQILFAFYFLVSLLYLKELVVAKNYNIASLSAEARRLSAEMKIPSAEVENPGLPRLVTASLSAEAQAPSEGDICLRSIVLVLIEKGCKFEEHIKMKYSFESLELRTPNNSQCNLISIHHNSQSVDVLFTCT